jgi:hypothetical protein
MTQGRLTPSGSKVLAVLGETPESPRMIAAKAELSEKTTRNALRSLVRAKLAIERRLPGRGGPRGYALPPSASIANAVTQSQPRTFP